MLVLIGVMFVLIGPLLAGVLITVGLVAPSLGMDDLQGITQLAIAGFVLAAPLAFVMARMLSAKR